MDVFVCLSVCLCVCLSLITSFNDCQPCLSVSPFVFFHLLSSSLLSSKTCHLVVDRAAHEFGALFVLGNLWKRLKSIHEDCQARKVGQAVWHHQLVLIEKFVHVEVREGEGGSSKPFPAAEEGFKLLKCCRQPFKVCFFR